MLSDHHDELSIRHIQEASRKMIQRLHGVSRSTFDADGEKQDGIMRQMEIIGEATSNPSEQFRWAHLRMDWRGMKDLRDVLLYGYAKVDLDEDWNIA